MRKTTQRLAAVVLILAALSAAGCAQNMEYSRIPVDQTQSRGGDGGGGGY